MRPFVAEAHHRESDDPAGFAGSERRGGRVGDQCRHPRRAIRPAQTSFYEVARHPRERRRLALARQSQFDQRVRHVGIVPPKSRNFSPSRAAYHRISCRDRATETIACAAGPTQRGDAAGWRSQAVPDSGRLSMERTNYKPLPMTRMRAGVVVQPPAAGPKPARLDSPAIEVMTDLRQVAAATIRADATIAQANRAMITRGVRLLLVVDVTGTVMGLITARDLV